MKAIVSKDCSDYDGGIHPVVYDEHGNKRVTVWVRKPVAAGASYDAEMALAEAHAWELAHIIAEALEEYGV